MHHRTDQSADDFLKKLIQFVQLLRGTGITIGTDQLLAVATALEAIDLADVDDFYTCLYCHFIHRHEQDKLFEQAFSLFWLQSRRMASGSETNLAALLAETDAESLLRRLVEALPERVGRKEQQLEITAAFSASAEEALREKDFAEMSNQELAEARRLLKACRFVFPERASRRYKTMAYGQKIDRQASFRSALRQVDAMPLRFCRQKKTPVPLVILCDISGSMAAYSRMLLHFMHSLSNDRDRVFSFVFATRLNNISRQLQLRDVDAAVDAAASRVQDWSGGTRIADCLKLFNQKWSRRVLTQGASVVLISDGLERETNTGLDRQMERLSKSCRELIWLNPLLRYESFEPRAEGIRCMLPYVDKFLPAHSINSLDALGQVLKGDFVVRAA